MSDTWEDIANSENSRRSSGKINNMRFESGKEYTVRFVGVPIKVTKYFIGGKSAITDADDNCVIKRKYSIEPSTRYAAYMFDRADGLLKINEFAPSVLKTVIAWRKRKGIEPGGPDGADFSVNVVGKQKNTRYEVLPLDITPFTEKELEMISKEIGGIDKASERLRKIFKPVPQDEIEERLFPKNDQSARPSNKPSADKSSNSSWGEKEDVPF